MIKDSQQVLIASNTARIVSVRLLARVQYALCAIRLFKVIGTKTATVIIIGSNTHRKTQSSQRQVSAQYEKITAFPKRMMAGFNNQGLRVAQASRVKKPAARYTSKGQPLTKMFCLVTVRTMAANMLKTMINPIPIKTALATEGGFSIR